MTHQIFERLSLGEVEAALQDQDHISLTPYLPYLCKLLQVVQGPQRTTIIHVLHKSSLAPTLHQLLNNDFTAVLSDAVKEQQLRRKTGTRREDSMLMPDGGSTVDSVFAGNDVGDKVRVIAAEMIYLQSQYTQGGVGSEAQGGVGSDAQSGVASDLLSYSDYQGLITAVICILCYRMPEVFDMKELLMLLVYLTNDTTHYINSLVVNNPERYVEVLHCFIDLFVQSKGALEQKVLGYLRSIASLVSDSSQYVTLDTISNIRKRIVIQSLLTPEEGKCSHDRMILSLFSDRETSLVIDFIKNESKVFDKLVRFSDFRERMITMISGVTCNNEEEEEEGVSTGDVTANSAVKQDKAKDQDDSFYCSFLDETIQEDMSKACQETVSTVKTTLTEPQVIRANHLLILYLNIVNTCRLSLQPRESRELVSLMLHKPPSGEEGDLFIKLSLSLYMSCTSLNSNIEVGNMIRRWLTDLLNYSYEGGRKGELILLTGMHLYSGTYEMIGPVLSQTTGLKVNVSAGHAATIQTLWSQIQSEEQIVSALTNVPVTPGLSGLVTGYLPVHCISQLINSRAPACPPNLFTWLPQQLRETREPVPAVLCELISGSVNFLMSNKGRSMSGISETELSSLLSPSNNMSCRVLAFYYLLLYRKGLSDLKVKVETQRSTAPPPTEYSVSLFGDDSAKTLLLHTRNNIQLYSAVYPTFLKLLVSQFPFLCDPKELLAEDEAKAHVSKLDKNSDAFDVKDYLHQILESLDRGDESRSYYMIRNMLKRHHEFIPSEIVARCVPHVVKHGFRVQGSFILLWEKSAALNPQQTWLNTAKTLINPKLTEDDVWANPLQLFQIPEKITRSPVGVKILLHILKGYLSLSRARLAESDPPQANKADQATKCKEHEDNKALYITLQNSAIVQLLLDLTSGSDTGHSGSTAIESNHAYENSALVYNFLHDFFINNDGLSKLVCWQTFKLSQIEGVVNGVPSLHVACKFSTNMLQQASLQKQLFAVCLLSHLAVQYPIQQTLQACNEMLQWAISQTSQQSTLWTLLSLESLVRISKAFPPLVDPITRLMVNQKKMLSKYSAGSIKQKLKVYSSDGSSVGNPQQMIDAAFQKITTDILVRMKGS